MLLLTTKSYEKIFQVAIKIWFDLFRQSCVVIFRICWFGICPLWWIIRSIIQSINQSINQSV